MKRWRAYVAMENIDKLCIGWIQFVCFIGGHKQR